MNQFRAILIFQHRYRKQLIVITGTLAIYWMLSSFYREVDYIFINENTNKKCVIPDLDPFDKSMLQFYVHLDPVKCDQTSDLVFVDSKGVLHVNHSAVADSGYRDVSCFYSVIKRVDDYEVKREAEVHFGKSVYVGADFFLVTCRDDEFRVVYENLHHSIDFKSQMQHHKFLNDSKKHLNVYIFGMDSLSRLAAERTIPITLRYIEQDLGGFIMKGYTKVGANTFPNLVSLLTGKVCYSKELPPHEKHLDLYPFIWKNFSNSGYVTMFSEDLPDMGTFTYWKGFKDQPAMHYMRPFYLALDTFGLPNTKRTSLISENNNIHLGNYSALCVKNTPKHHFYMNYYKQFITFYGNKRKFALGWLNELTHGYDNLVQLADRDYMLFFKWLKESGRLDHSILILMSDHGIMQRDIKNTLAGRTENRMPIFAIVIPPHLKSKYPHIPRNLQTNTKRLSTAYDVHETLVDILESDFLRSMKKVNELEMLPRGISLFREIPERRSCDDAAIPGDYCVCNSYEPMDANGAISKDIGQFLVTHINQALSKHGDKCANLHISHIKNSYFVKSNLQRRRENEEFTLKNLFRPDPDIKKYLSVFETRPGNALFEALVNTNDEGSYDVIGRVNRINKYGNQSWCVKEKFSKPLCFCS